MSTTAHRTAYEQLSYCDLELYWDLLDWVRHGRLVNNLVRAAIHNDFEQVMCCRHNENLDTLIALAKTIYNYVPSIAWKTKDNINAWAKARAEDPWLEFTFGDML